MALKAVRVELLVTSSIEILDENKPLASVNLLSTFSINLERTTILTLNLQAMDGLVLSENTTYTVKVAGGLVQDSGNRKYYSPDYTFQFTTNGKPTTVSYYPTLGSTNEPENAYFKITFNRKVKLTPLCSVRVYKITPSGGELLVTQTSNIENVNELTYKINVKGKIIPGGQYYILITPNSFADYDNFKHIGITDPNAWRFTVAGEPEFPDLTSLDISEFTSSCTALWIPSFYVRYISPRYNNVWNLNSYGSSVFINKDNQVKEYTMDTTDGKLKEARDILMSVMDKNPELYDILIKKYYYGMTNKEIGQANGYGKEAARKKLKKAIELCRQIVYTNVGTGT